MNENSFYKPFSATEEKNHNFHLLSILYMPGVTNILTHSFYSSSQIGFYHQCFSFVLATLHSLPDLSSPSREWTRGHSMKVLFFQGARSFNCMSAVTICGDFGAQENKVWHCFHCFPIYLLWSDGTRCHDLGFLNVEL